MYLLSIINNLVSYNHSLIIPKVFPFGKNFLHSKKKTQIIINSLTHLIYQLKILVRIILHFKFMRWFFWEKRKILRNHTVSTNNLLNNHTLMMNNSLQNITISLINLIKLTWLTSKWKWDGMNNYKVIFCNSWKHPSN